MYRKIWTCQLICLLQKNIFDWWRNYWSTDESSCEKATSKVKPMNCSTQSSRMSFCFVLIVSFFTCLFRWVNFMISWIKENIPEFNVFDCLVNIFSRKSKIFSERCPGSFSSEKWWSSLFMLFANVLSHTVYEDAKLAQFRRWRISLHLI